MRNNFEEILETSEEIPNAKLMQFIYKWLTPPLVTTPVFTRRYFKSFALLICSPQKVNKWTSNQTLHYLHHNLLFDIITITSETIFISIDEFVDACGIPHWLLSNCLSLQGSSLVLICPTFNLCTHWFTVDFVIIFCVPYTTHNFVWISLLETFATIKNWITLRCSSLAQLLVLLPSIFFSSLCNF